MFASLRRQARRSVERILIPHLNTQVAQIDQLIADRLAAASPDVANGGSPPADLDPILVDFNYLLHELRTIELRRLPVHGGTLLSAGCAGRWYFDWLEQCVGPFDRHIGVELYAEEPEDLPSNATWIAESASAMPGVADNSVDVVFSGQNLEHMWIDDIVGFLLESSRVLRPGGTLAVDSPNRYATEALGWVHPEHTIELTAGEAIDLFALAGFEQRVARGLWNCRDQATGDWRVIVDGVGDVAVTLDRAAGRFELDDSFVWWLEVERTGEPVARPELRAAVAELFSRHWNKRVNRGASCVGTRSGSDGWTISAGTSGIVYRTQPFPLFPGAFTVHTTAPDAGLNVRLVRLDDSEIASGAGLVEGVLESAELGVIAEIVATAPLGTALVGLEVVVDAEPHDGPR